MNQEQLIRFKELFLDQKRNLIYSQSVLNEDFQLQKDDLMDDVDLTTSEMETSMRMRLRNREALLVKKIDEALRRIETGSFGECEDCGGEIELKRLEARPTACLCIDCKETEERKELLHIDGHQPKSLGAKIRLG